MDHVIVRDCLLDRLYARGERVDADAARRWPEHVEAVAADADDTEAGDQTPNEKQRQQQGQSQKTPRAVREPTLSDGTSPASMTRRQMRAWAAARHPGRTLAWGRRADMAARLMALDRGE